MPYFRKKPVVIEARRYDGTNLKELAQWSSYNVYRDIDRMDDAQIKVSTLEGVIWAQVGDWIVRGIKGEYYPVKPDIFEQTYEEVSGIYADEPT